MSTRPAAPRMVDASRAGTLWLIDKVRPATGTGTGTGWTVTVTESAEVITDPNKAVLPHRLKGMGGAPVRRFRQVRPDSVRRASRARMDAMVFMNEWVRYGVEVPPVRPYRCPGEATAR